ncbi:MAG TPA: nucleotide sugar dehydrogenase [Anaerolineae bacterium]|nr:nucleotide sugar dehydrogenase [Ardenticatenia bacterium]HQZ70041.1 nucleotide sugar dehydrogenase [Anaerolineae bacterium]HRA18969.1 nucleotide sugar dehydrogenase [Anaerolineae bacterium]
MSEPPVVDPAVDAPSNLLAQRIADRSAVVGVVGLGYVGLPLAVALAECGYGVRGLDIAVERVARISEGRSPIGDVADERLSPLVSAGRLSASTDDAILAACDVVFVCVPTPFDANKTPDLRAVIAAADAVAGRLRAGQLIILQSTTYPGTTEEVILPRLAATGLAVGKDVHLAFSPERIDPGVSEHTVRNTPKVVGGLTARCAALAAALLGTLGPEVKVVSSPRVAEMTKLLENIFRSVNIALVNELALLAERMDIDIWEVIGAAATKPFGFMPFWPGPGVGGHCIPIDPYYLAWKAREYDFSTRFIELAADINQSMPAHVADLLGAALDRRGRTVSGARILVLGVAFKPDVDDSRHSPAERVIALLLARGATVAYHDPYIRELAVGGDVFHPQRTVLQSRPLDDEALTWADAALILTAHRAMDVERVLAAAPLVVDATRATAGRQAPNLVRLGTPLA